VARGTLLHSNFWDPLYNSVLNGASISLTSELRYAGNVECTKLEIKVFSWHDVYTKFRENP
jgi:hypothetical protein